MFSTVRDRNIEKVRDAEDAYALAAFTLIPVGDSVVLVPIDAPAQPRKIPTLTPAERIALDALNEVLTDRDRRRDATIELIGHGAKYGQHVVLIDDWRAGVYARLGSDNLPDAKRKSFLRARERLTANRRVGIHDDYVWLL